MTELLRAAVHGGSDEIVETVFRWTGTDVNERLDSSGTTPLLHACNASRGDVVKRLLALGAGPNLNGAPPPWSPAENLGSWKPLHAAAYHGAAGIVETLLQHHADVEARTGDGSTPLVLALQELHRPRMFSWEGLKPADKERYKKVIELLLLGGAIPNKRSLQLLEEMEYRDDPSNNEPILEVPGTFHDD